MVILIYKRWSGTIGQGITYDFHLADFEMYKVNDKDKTNLLSTNSESTTLGVWHWAHGKLSGLNWSRGSYKVVGYVKYDESIFNYAKENRLSNQMLYFLNSGSNVVAAQRVRVEVGKTYMYTFSISCPIDSSTIEVRGLLDAERETLQDHAD